MRLETGDNSDRKWSGRPKATTQSEEVNSLHDGQLTGQQLQAELKTGGNGSEFQCCGCGAAARLHSLPFRQTSRCKRRANRSTSPDKGIAQRTPPGLESPCADANDPVKSVTIAR
ncbi:hypothetical protein KOW79_002090 [Hemibagrus wyckioides]|uniref:Uncharacterized protein n=1 Tax=Hemibagrus wyckioides TaxID=337641 RepID=A0A9D3P2Y4_9TELE|nr:hypothetical protein KOW79_002090 [Hemibagrus wyckioides]